MANADRDAHSSLLADSGPDTDFDVFEFLSCSGLDLLLGGFPLNSSAFLFKASAVPSYPRIRAIVE